jgi:hypothetical protein
MRGLYVLGLSALCAACVLEPDVGEPIAGVCKNEDTDREHDVSFEEDVLPLLTESCGCHDPAKFGSAIDLVGFSIENYGKVRRGGANSGEEIVIEGDPCNSILLQKLSEAPPFGVRMPTFGPYLSRKEMALLHDWIAEGAHDN